MHKDQFQWTYKVAFLQPTYGIGQILSLMLVHIFNLTLLSADQKQNKQGFTKFC